MNAKLQRLRDDPGRLKLIEVRPQPPAKEIVAELLIAQKAYYRESMSVKGRFNSRAELIEFISHSLLEGRSSLAIVAANAGIAIPTLRNIISSRKLERKITTS
ncbi:hypothetical protein [Sphingomonas sp. AX6]|uniref:hypothetical protein n=1 Tax=Sphingomonas sp. AX6 TaxID=2653171 RepID=UPI001357F433|nr:hypothetical protein [Sphingomonas sp. AX6]